MWAVPAHDVVDVLKATELDLLNDKMINVM